MKTRFLTLLAAILTLIATFGSGCATGGGGGALTLKQISYDVETAMQAYRNADVAGSLTLAERQNVNAAYSTYRKAFDEAAAQVRGNLQTTAPANVTQTANNLISIINAIPE